MTKGRIDAGVIFGRPLRGKTADVVHLLTVITPSNADEEADRVSLIAHLAHHGVAVEAKTIWGAV